jgi:membrane protein insertase Oxa1/YidC/SpoIIIJ
MLGLLDTLFLQPLMLVYAFVYNLFPTSMSPGSRLIAFSIVLNLALLPIYNQMEKRSRRGRAVKEQVAREVARMKAHFRGRERYFYIRAVYRQYRYHPISELLGSADLFVQILVFATVYRFLSGLPELAGAAFGPIADLSRPDGLLGGVNALPLLMTAINVAAVFSYIEDRGRRIQALALAAIFLALLYASPAGLVLYWTTNNLWSLARNLLKRSPVPGWTQRIMRPLNDVLLQR